MSDLTSRPSSTDRCVRRSAPSILVVQISFLFAFAAQGLLADDIREIPLGNSSAHELIDQFGQPLTALAGGGFGVIWVSGLPESYLHIQWLDPAGEILFESGGRVIAGPGVRFASMAAHPSGGAFVAFGEPADQGFQLLVQFFDATGAPQWPGTGVPVSNLAEDQSPPALVADLDGGVFACFSAAGVRCQRLNAAGEQQWSPAANLAGASEEFTSEPQGVLDDEGRLMIFWINLRNAFDETLEFVRIEGQRFDDDGQIVWDSDGLLVHQTSLAETDRFGPTMFEVASDCTGGAVVAFNDWIDQSEPNFDVAAQRVSPVGELLWGDGAAVVASPSHFQHETTISAPGGGAFVVTTEDVNESESRLWLYRLDGSGQHLFTPPLELSDPSSPGLHYSTHGSFDEGLLRLAWTKEVVPFSLEMNVELATLTLDGERREETVTSAVGAQFCHGLAYSPDTGETLVLWEDYRSGDWDDPDVYSAMVSGDGSIFQNGFESGSLDAWSATVGDR
ncbi:MAG: hypothetical protein MPN21_02705 [Thermoanaerobaculia bacterium]|nr:hypothetical protein [Thermoanaerobaculia bacterium]